MGKTFECKDKIHLSLFQQYFLSILFIFSHLTKLVVTEENLSIFVFV